MDRWAALSQVESGDKDTAVGRAGEVSRFQILPELWERYAPKDAHWENPGDALKVAKQVMQERCDDFEKQFKRSPTDFEFYVLWNKPAEVERPSRAAAERAERFCNLVRRP
jgi:hypothetical protein